MKTDHRVKYNQRYTAVFGHDPDAMRQIEASENEATLSDLVQSWLERTPGLELDGFNFWGKFRAAVEKQLSERNDAALVSLKLL